MDQFATGLVGTRTPYGICSSVFHPSYISGGSSSGSAVAVAGGLVSFSLGTDTAGSGRVPAAFNQLVGLKPTRGLVSTAGLLPACKTLDCVSIFAETCHDASKVLEVIEGLDSTDPYSRVAQPGDGATPWLTTGFRFGVPNPEEQEFFGDIHAKVNYEAAIVALQELGGEAVFFDYSCFKDAASLLYEGPWVAERLAAVEEFVQDHADALDPTVGKIILGAARFTAAETFKAEYRLKELQKKSEEILDQADLLLLPTTPTIYRIDEVVAEPVILNSRLGYYTNFVNLLDLAAISVPSGMRPDGLPSGVSLVSRAFTDQALAILGDKVHRKLASSLGGSSRPLAETPALQSSVTPEGCILLAVVGAHLVGQPLNWQFTSRKARLIQSTRTDAHYRLFVLPNSQPAKPGLLYDPGYLGAGIEIEVWAVPEDTIGSFLEGIPAPLCLGTVRLADGSKVKGFLCEPSGIDGAQEITGLGGWRAYLESAK
jgi:allophanate hydrolase